MPLKKIIEFLQTLRPTRSATLRAFPHEDIDISDGQKPIPSLLQATTHNQAQSVETSIRPPDVIRRGNYYGDAFWMSHYEKLLKVCPNLNRHFERGIRSREVQKYFNHVREKGEVSLQQGNFRRQMRNIAKFGKPLCGTPGVKK